MPRAKSLSHYPARYAEIIEACAVRGATGELDIQAARSLMGVGPEHGDLQVAIKLRGHFYAYVGALKKAKREGATGDILEKANQSEMVVLAIQDNPVRLIFQNREKAWQAIAAGLVKLSDGESKPTAKGLDAIAERLARVERD